MTLMFTVEPMSEEGERILSRHKRQFSVFRQMLENIARERHQQSYARDKFRLRLHIGAPRIEAAASRKLDKCNLAQFIRLTLSHAFRIVLGVGVNRE